MGDAKLIEAVEQGKVSVSAAASQAANKDEKKKKQTKHRDPNPKDLKKQIDEFKAEWEELNGSQKRHFVKTNQHELAELLEELEALEEEQTEEEDQPAVS